MQIIVILKEWYMKSTKAEEMGTCLFTFSYMHYFNTVNNLLILPDRMQSQAGVNKCPNAIKYDKCLQNFRQEKKGVVIFAFD